MNSRKQAAIMQLLAKHFPSLIPWMEAQYHFAIMKDMTTYRDEPNAMIALVEYGASLEAFADAIAEASIEEMFHLMAEHLGGDFQ